MIVRTLGDIVGSERDIAAASWSSRRLILADDRMRGLFVEFIGRSVYDQIRAG